MICWRWKNGKSEGKTYFITEFVFLLQMSVCTPIAFRRKAGCNSQNGWIFSFLKNNTFALSRKDVWRRNCLYIYSSPFYPLYCSQLISRLSISPLFWRNRKKIKFGRQIVFSSGIKKGTLYEYTALFANSKDKKDKEKNSNFILE